MSAVCLYILFYLLVLATPATPLAVRRPASTTSTRADPIDLRQYFDDRFASASEFLSPKSIVELIPKGAATSTSTVGTAPAKPPLRQEMFASPLISVMYERILPPLWAAGLRIGGPDEEYQNAASYLLEEDAQAGGTGIALDLSCGTGFVGIRMAKSGRFRHVFALDYSRQMLNEAVATVKRESGSASGGAVDLPLSIIRGDAGRLPFKDGTIDFVHWGAAMHCVPNAEQAMKEVHRVLKRGGKYTPQHF